MSTVSSPTSVDGHHHLLTGFREQSLDDPFLASSPHEEQLLQLSSRIATSVVLEAQTTKQTNHTGSGVAVQTTSNSSCPKDTSLTGAASYLRRDVPIHEPNISPRGTTIGHTPYPEHSQHQSASFSPTTASEFLSPTAFYTDAGYSELSEIATPSFDDDFFLDADFGLIPTIQPEEDLHYSRKSHGLYSSRDSSVSEAPSPRCVNHKDQSSLGAADKSSSLLSPMLTNSPSPPVGREPYRHLDMGPAPISGGVNDPSLRHDTATTPTRMELREAGSQHTPALTGSPSNASLEVEPVSHIGRAASPIVRVESYSRGDSPARVPRLGRSSSKRTRGSLSSALLAPYGEDLSEDEIEHEQRDQDLEHSGVAASTLQTGTGPLFAGRAVGRKGVSPDMRSQLNEDHIPTLQEQEDLRHLNEKNAEVEDWLVYSEAGSEATAEQPQRAGSRAFKASGERRRARSMGDQAAPRANIPVLGAAGASYNYSGIPGPGVLLDEESGEEEDGSVDTDDDLPESPPASIDEDVTFSTVNEPPSAAEPYRSRPWQDPPYDPAVDGSTAQPATANAAIMRFNQRADNIETASRAATWGTRRLSDTDIGQVARDRGILKRLSFGREKDKSKDKSERRGSFLGQAATKLLPKRTNSNLRRKTVPGTLRSSNPDVPEASRDDSGSAPSKLHKKTKQPINTGSAVAAMAGQFAAIGGSGSIGATAAATPHGPWTQAVNAIKRTRSRSELGDTKSSESAHPGLMDLILQHGGPPMPTLASPPNELPHAKPFGPPGDNGDEEVDEGEVEDETMDDKGVVMDFEIRADDINPTFEGFRSNVHHLNPRLVEYLVDRIGREQVRRYKKLLEFKVKHLKAVSDANCTSGRHCFALGGEASVLPSKASAKAPESSYTSHQITDAGASDNDSSPSGEGIVASAQLPPGVPLPPVKSLPREFECPLCFKVRKFQKPSDWTKHVHEDVQPFTCTFPNCAEPKSFKRKADWVRHENERHRQLEWWTCNMPDCSHTCYRKDNFVQHLVREHKKPEPKTKSSRAPVKATGRAKAGRSQLEIIEDWKAVVPGSLDPAQAEVDKVWALVEECRHDTKKLPREEACKFCGNVCNSWKKLTVHLAKHMEQISMPVLRLVEQQVVTLDTIISPVEQRIPLQRIPQQQQSVSPQSSVRMPKFESHSASPLGIPAHVSPAAGNPEDHYLSQIQGAYNNPTGVQATGGYTGEVPDYNIPLNRPILMSSRPDFENAPHLMPPYQEYQEQPTEHFIPVNSTQGFSRQPSLQGTGDYGVYSEGMAGSIAGYTSAEATLPFYNTQQTLVGPMGGAPFLYSNPDGIAPMPSVITPVPMQYNPTPRTPFTQAPSGSSPQYQQTPQNYLYRQQ